MCCRACSRTAGPLFAASQREKEEEAARLKAEEEEQLAEAARLAAGVMAPAGERPASPTSIEAAPAEEVIVDVTNVWEPIVHPPQVVIAPDPQRGPGVYTVQITAYTMGPYVVHLVYDGTEVRTPARPSTNPPAGATGRAQTRLSVGAH